IAADRGAVAEGAGHALGGVARDGGGVLAAGCVRRNGGPLLAGGEAGAAAAAEAGIGDDADDGFGLDAQRVLEADEPADGSVLLDGADGRRIEQALDSHGGVRTPTQVVACPVTGPRAGPAAGQPNSSATSRSARAARCSSPGSSTASWAHRYV